MLRLTITFAALLSAAAAFPQQLHFGAEQRIAAERRVASHLDVAPAAASDGTNFLVVANRGTDLVATRVSPGGQVLDPNGILLPMGGIAQDVEFINGRYVVVTQSELITITTEGRVGVRQPLLYGVRGEAAAVGGVLAFPTMFAGQAAVAIYSAAGEQFILQRVIDFGNAADYLTIVGVHRLGGGFAAVQRPLCGNGYCIAVQPFDASGELTGVRQQFSLGTGHYAPAASNGSELLFTWLDADGVKARAVTTSGISAETKLDTTPVNPAVEAIGNDFAGRVNNRQLVVRAEPDPVVVSTETDGIWDALAFNGREVLYVSPLAVPGRITARVGTAGDPFGLFTAPADRRAPAVADGIGATFVVWEERNAAGNEDVRGAIVRPGQAPVEMLIQPDGRAPAVAFDGHHFLVVYRYRQGLAARRIAQDGTVLEPMTVAEDATSHPAIAAANGRALVAWTAGARVFGTRMTDGRVVDRPALVLDEAALGNPKDFALTRVAWSGTDWVVAFAEQDGPTFIHAAYALRVATNGAVTMPRTEIGRGWDAGAITLVGSDRGALAVHLARNARLTLFHDLPALLLPNDGPPRTVRLPVLSEPTFALAGFRDGSGYVVLYSEARVIGQGATGTTAIRIFDDGDWGQPQLLDPNRFTPAGLRAFRHGIVYISSSRDIVLRYLAPPARRRSG